MKEERKKKINVDLEVVKQGNHHCINNDRNGVSMCATRAVTVTNGSVNVQNIMRVNDGCNKKLTSSKEAVLLYILRNEGYE